MKPLYVIKWKDAWHSGSNYYNSDRQHKPLQCYDVGFLMEENEEGITIASSYDDDNDDGRHVSFFPWEMVISMEVLV